MNKKKKKKFLFNLFTKYHANTQSVIKLMRYLLFSPVNPTLKKENVKETLSLF